MNSGNRSFNAGSDIEGKTLAQCVSQALDDYFRELAGHETSNLYQMVLAEVEKPMLKSVLKYVSGNQTRAAAILGISRGTLRKKLGLHGLD